MMEACDIEPRNGWSLWEDDYEDGDRFWRKWYEARHPEHGHRLLQVSDFNWLVENNFPLSPTKGPWSSAEIDKRIADATST
jgi:hypothetical protein